MKKFLFVLIILSGCGLSAVYAIIDVHATFLTTRDGLTNNTIRTLYQDGKGFLWIGTLNGMNRYDGHSFVTFLPQRDKGLTLNEQHINRIGEDQNGFLWIASTNDIYSCYDLAQDSFVDYTGCGEYDQAYANRTETSGKDSWLWGSRNGCRRVIYQGGVFTSSVYRQENGRLPSNQVNYLFEDETGTVWICTQSGLVKVSDGQTEIVDWDRDFIAGTPHQKGCFFLTSGGEVYLYQNGTGLKNLLTLKEKAGGFSMTSHLRLQSDWLIFTKRKSYMVNLSSGEISPDVPIQIANGKFVQDNLENYYIYNGTGELHYLQKDSRELKRFQLISPEKITPASGEQYKVVQDKRGLIWISVFGNGLFIYDSRKDDMTHYTYQEEGRNRISSNFLTRLLIDRSENIWVGSEHSGITCLSVLNDGASFIYPEDKSLGDYSNTIRILTRMPNGDIWAVNRNGKIYVYDSGLQPGDPRTAPYSYIYAVAEDASGKLWLGSRGNGVCIDGRWYKNDPDDPNSLSYDHIFRIYRDNKGRMWIGTFGGGLDLAIQEEGKYSFRHFLTGSLSQQEIRTITQDKYGRMWVGTDNGLCTFDPDSLIADPTNYSLYSYNNGRLPGNEIKYIFRDSKDRMWVGMLGKGIALCTPAHNYRNLQFTHYTTASGLVNNMVEAILEDRSGKFWISTEYGISRFDADKEIFENYFFSASMQGNIHNESSALVMDDGSLLFGTNHGLVLIDPEKVTSDARVPDIVFTDLKQNGESVHPHDPHSPLDKALGYADVIRFNYNQNSFVIEFSTLDYSITNEARYSYKLEPFDKDWSTPSSLNFAAYKNLEPGTYQLYVRTGNPAGLWSDRAATLQIVISPPFWRTIWAYLVYVVVMGLALYLIFRLVRKFNTLRNRIEVEKQLTEYKLMFFTNISHEFRTPLTLIQGALEKMEYFARSSKEMVYPVHLMSKSTDRMLRLINQLLEFRKMQNNKLKLQLEEADVIAFLKEIFLSFEDIASDQKIDYRFDPSVLAYRMFIDKGKLDKIAYNIVSNAFKYTPNGGKIVFKVAVEEATGKLTVVVSDTGIGIPKEKQKELFSRFMQSSFSHDSVGVGLHLTRELVSIYKGVISYQENERGGSVFTVSLPLDSGVYEEKDFLMPDLLLEDPSPKDPDYRKVALNGKLEYKVPLNRKSVLIIEDDNDVRGFLEAELSVYFEVVAEPDGISGLERARVMEVDLIVCDVLMPGMNGFEVTGKLKSDFNTSHIPIVLLTAMGAPENELQGVESGADAYITKPFSPRLLIARIFQLIEQREKLRVRFSANPAMITPALCSTDLDKRFAGKLKAIVEKQLANPEFTVEDFASALNLGRTILFRKVKGITGYTPMEYLRIIRMKKAMELLQSGQYNISEIAWQVGMKDPLYFSKCFKAQFGDAPSAYLGRKNDLTKKTDQE